MGTVAIHVLPAGDGPPVAPERRDPTGERVNPTDYARVAAMVALTTGIGVLLSRLIGVGTVDLLFLIPVMAAALALRPAARHRGRRAGGAGV